MPEIMNVLRERARDNDEKNDIYFTQKQKRVLKTIAENPHASASEVADMAEVHPSYIPYICERVDMEVVENLHRLDEYLTEREEMNTIPNKNESSSSQPEEQEESDAQAKEAEEIMETFGAKPTVDDHQRPPADGTTEFTFTKEVPVQISVRFPNSEEITRMIEEEQDEEDEDRPALTAD